MRLSHRLNRSFRVTVERKWTTPLICLGWRTHVLISSEPESFLNMLLTKLCISIQQNMSVLCTHKQNQYNLWQICSKFRLFTNPNHRHVNRQRRSIYHRCNFGPQLIRPSLTTNTLCEAPCIWWLARRAMRCLPVSVCSQVVYFSYRPSFICQRLWCLMFNIVTCEASRFDSSSNRTSDSGFDSYW